MLSKNILYISCILLMYLHITYKTTPDKKGNVVMGKALRKPVPSPPHEK